jgi:hypothetical protein
VDTTWTKKYPVEVIEFTYFHRFFCSRVATTLEKSVLADGLGTRAIQVLAKKKLSGGI